MRHLEAKMVEDRTCVLTLSDQSSLPRTLPTFPITEIGLYKLSVTEERNLKNWKHKGSSPKESATDEFFLRKQGK
jgi:hypothetical protein